MMSDLETNKKNVVEFYDLIINKKDFESARKYMGDHYRQHNPRVADGPDGLRAHIEDLKKNFPEVHSEIKKDYRGRRLCCASRPFTTDTETTVGDH